MQKICHIAIIMDGNGRWALGQNQPRIYGHRQGVHTVRNITIQCAAMGLEVLTLYAFSTENWRRKNSEVSALMKLLSQYLKSELKTYIKHNIRFETIGDLSKFSTSLQQQIALTKAKTSDNTGLTQVLALNYGAKDELVRACKKLAAAKLAFSEDNINQHLDTMQFPAVDLLIRTGGEQRLSNFLLWQLAYSEFFFTQTLWPDFNVAELEQICQEFNNRTRRFGGN